MRKGIILAIIVGIIIGSVGFAWWMQRGPPTVEVVWTEEAEEYVNCVRSMYIILIPGQDIEAMIAEWRDNAEELASQTDLIVHLIDIRLGVATVWWEQSQAGNLFPGRYNWTTAWARLRQVEEFAEECTPPVDWSDEAVKYYWNPGDPYFGVPDQPDCMVGVLHLEFGENTPEFRDVMALATEKAEEIANQTDKVVDLTDLREAIATILHQQYPDTYPTMVVAWTRLEELEGQVGCPLNP